MRQASGTIERAYQLAGTGHCRTIDEIVRRLTAEGYDSPQAHLAGKGLRLELRKLIKARENPSAARPTGTEPGTEPNTSAAG
ncbi:hypothetical protein [Sphingomonas abietis]|uniref:KfrA N-terminal DNA-binding domain-containing protein n=1 Tax=Sphingomonas abietis TaxID=3012344 RepID=A0ABY7NID4_9SPHN|nr:hypothetical protein [Sphingomonas abietis]WBO21032.1 hypothetical protein PBT88_12540 [Sphingomonas abietis]